MASLTDLESGSAVLQVGLSAGLLVTRLLPASRIEKLVGWMRDQPPSARAGETRRAREGRRETHCAWIFCSPRAIFPALYPCPDVDEWLERVSPRTMRKTDDTFGDQLYTALTHDEAFVRGPLARSTASNAKHAARGSAGPLWAPRDALLRIGFPPTHPDQPSSSMVLRKCHYQAL